MKKKIQEGNLEKHWSSTCENWNQHQCAVNTGKSFCMTDGKQDRVLWCDLKGDVYLLGVCYDSLLHFKSFKSANTLTHRDAPTGEERSRVNQFCWLVFIWEMAALRAGWQLSLLHCKWLTWSHRLIEQQEGGELLPGWSKNDITMCK